MADASLMDPWIERLQQVQILCTRVMAQTFRGLQKIQELDPDERMS